MPANVVIKPTAVVEAEIAAAVAPGNAGKRAQLSFDTAGHWSVTNPVLAANERAYATDTGVEKIGDGATAWNALPAVGSSTYVSLTPALLQYAAAPDTMASGTITRSATGAATGFSVAWPDGATGTFTGTESTSFPGAIDAYTVTHVLGGTTTTYTQAALTRDGSGNVTSRPAITVA